MDRHRVRPLLKKLYYRAAAESTTLLLTTAGVAIYVFGVVNFTIPYRLPDSGLMGIAILLKYVLGLSTAAVTFAANIGLLIWGGRYLSKRFILWTIYNIVLLSALLALFQDTATLPFMNDMFLVAVAGGMIKGLGLGLVFKTGACSGGLDVVIAVMRRKLGIEVGKYSFYCNMFILAASLTTVGVEKALFGIVASYTTGYAMDSVISSFDKRKLIFVVTHNTDMVTEYVAKHLNRGATVLYGRGAYFKGEKNTVMCLLTPRQAMELKHFLAQSHPSAFMVITDASEVLGKGFKQWKNL